MITQGQHDEKAYAQWLIERGQDEKSNFIYWFCFAACPPLMIPAFPVFCWIWWKGRKMQAEGRAINAEHGWENYTRPVSVNTRFLHVPDMGPDTRYRPVSMRPPSL